MKKEVQNPNDVARLEKLGWKNEFTGHNWSWREPKTLALYKYTDALAIINLRKTIGGKHETRN
jgi:hypothetical protein